MSTINRIAFLGYTMSLALNWQSHDKVLRFEIES